MLYYGNELPIKTVQIYVNFVISLGNKEAPLLFEFPYLIRVKFVTIIPLKVFMLLFNTIINNYSSIFDTPLIKFTILTVRFRKKFYKMYFSLDSFLPQLNISINLCAFSNSHILILFLLFALPPQTCVFAKQDSNLN